MGHYKLTAIETFENPGEPSGSAIRARPLAGQGYSTDLRVECSSMMRRNYPVGTVFIVEAQLKENSVGTQYLYTHYNWPFEVVDKKQAERRIQTSTL